MTETKQYIQFTLGQENYAVQISSVLEIIKPLEVRNLIGAPSFVLGVCQVRDELIIIIDLHKKFCISTANLEKGEPRFIILEFESKHVGLYVDDVVDIIETISIEEVPDIVHYGTICDIIKLEDGLIPILDIDQLFPNNATTWLNSGNDELVS